MGREGPAPCEALGAGALGNVKAGFSGCDYQLERLQEKTRYLPEAIEGATTIARRDRPPHKGSEKDLLRQESREPWAFLLEQLNRELYSEGYSGNSSMLLPRVPTLARWCELHQLPLPEYVDKEWLYSDKLYPPMLVGTITVIICSRSSPLRRRRPKGKVLLKRHLDPEKYDLPLGMIETRDRLHCRLAYRWRETEPALLKIALSGTVLSVDSLLREKGLTTAENLQDLPGFLWDPVSLLWEVSTLSLGVKDEEFICKTPKYAF